MSHKSKANAAQASSINNDCYQISDEDDLEDESFLDEVTTKRNSRSNGKENTSIRGPYERAWTTEATRALIHTRGPMEEKFNEGRQQRTTLWLYVTKQLHKLGFRYSPAKVQKKWHNILITYNKNISKKEESGYVHWEFFEEMYKYLEGKRGTYDRSSTNICIGGGEESYQFQQTFIESDEPYEQPDDIEISNDNSPTIDFEDSPKVEAEPEPDEDDVEIVTKKKKYNNYYENDIDYSEKLPLEISQVRSGQDVPSDLIVPKREEIMDDHDQNMYENRWWQDYFDRKLQSDADKLQLQKDMHHELMNFNKMSLMQQEKIERIKIDAINNLTSTLQKLVEAKNKK